MSKFSQELLPQLPNLPFSAIYCFSQWVSCPTPCGVTPEPVPNPAHIRAPIVKVVRTQSIVTSVPVPQVRMSTVQLTSAPTLSQGKGILQSLEEPAEFNPWLSIQSYQSIQSTQSFQGIVGEISNDKHRRSRDVKLRFTLQKEQQHLQSLCRNLNWRSLSLFYTLLFPRWKSSFHNYSSNFLSVSRVFWAARAFCATKPQPETAGSPVPAHSKPSQPAFSMAVPTIVPGPALSGSPLVSPAEKPFFYLAIIRMSLKIIKMAFAIIWRYLMKPRSKMLLSPFYRGFRFPSSFQLSHLGCCLKLHAWVRTCVLSFSTKKVRGPIFYIFFFLFLCRIFGF